MKALLFRSQLLSRVLRSLKIGLILSSVFLSSSAWTKVEYDSNQLMMKNSEQISDLVRKKIKKAQEIQAKQESSDDSFAEPAAVEQLREALRIVLARPDQDGERDNAFARIRKELLDLDILEKTLAEIAHEAIVNIRSDSTAPNRLMTYVIMLENLMAEIKPELGDNPEFKKIISAIRDADLKIPPKVKEQQLMRSMSRMVSPSETAAKILPKPKS